jgi:5'-nucleotidase/UDP-sugar diphosphatase
VKRLSLLIVVAALGLLALAPVPADVVSLTILHTNDTHGHLLPFSYPTIVPQGSELEGLKQRRDIGGIARRAALAAKIRAEVASRKGTTWLVDVGDFSDGTPFSTEYHGDADVAAMNAAGYTLATLGNHEFNYPLAKTRALIAALKYPVVLANAFERATGKPLAQASRIEQVEALRVGVFGLVTHEAGDYPAAKEGVDIGDEIQAAQKAVASLKGRADVIVLLSHCGEDVDQRLAAEVPGIDVIVGGHSHSRLPSGEFVWRGDDLRADDVNGTVIVQAHQWGGELGRLDLLFAKDSGGAWHVDRYRARLIPVTPDLPSDQAVAAVVEKFWRPIAPKFGEVLGTAGGDFSSRGDDDASYNLVADAVRETMGTDVEFENSGGVRAPLVAGAITRGAMVDMDPFNNTVVTFKITGRQVRQVLIRHTPYVSGIRYRLVDRQLVDVSVGGQPLDDDRTYTGSSNSYFANYALKDLGLQDTGRGRLDVITEYVRKTGTVKPAYDGRRIIMGARRPE